MRSPRVALSLMLIIAGAGLLGARPSGEVPKSSFRSTEKAILTGGNQIYTIHVEDSGSTCGMWTATTGPMHPAGMGLNVLFGNGSPGTSNTTLRSYSSGTDYVTGSVGAGCSAICSSATPVVTPILNGATTVGYRFVWSFADGGGAAIQFEQEVVVEGPVDATATVNNSVVRETHTVRNLGPGSLTFGLRKQWDWQIGNDDGPYFGACITPTEACDTSMNLTPNGTLDGQYPNAYIMNEDPAVTSCPTGVTPVNGPCGGAPVYVVAGTVAPPSSLSPPPDAPELLQFNSWPNLIGTCWQPALSNNATCAAGDTALAYFYGLTPATGITLTPGQSRSFTEYISAGQNGCPGIIQGPGIPTLNNVGLAVLVLMLLLAALVMLRRRSATA